MSKALCASQKSTAPIAWRMVVAIKIVLLDPSMVCPRCCCHNVFSYLRLHQPFGMAEMLLAGIATGSFFFQIFGSRNQMECSTSQIPHCTVWCICLNKQKTLESRSCRGAGRGSCLPLPLALCWRRGTAPAPARVFPPIPAQALGLCLLTLEAFTSSPVIPCTVVNRDSRGCREGPSSPRCSSELFHSCTTSPPNHLYLGRKAFTGQVPASEDRVQQKWVCIVQMSIPVHSHSCAILSGV